MKYLSVCSGIEAATVAWHGLGWHPAAFAEIEPFPAAVLAHRYPKVPNLGDLTKYREWPEELLAEVELLVGGTPCQAFSVAGQRRSLDDERGNLSLIYVNLYHHINEVRKRHGRPPAIALWENVPGVLSTKDNAFGCFIGGLLGCDEAPQTENGKWSKAGFLSSETVRVGYRVLDAQYFGVAQRRRRVFLVAVPCELVERFGERACPSEILSLRESVLGNPPARGAAWEGVARATAAGLTSSGRGVERRGESRGQDDVVIARGIAVDTYNQTISDTSIPLRVGNAKDSLPAVIWSSSDQANAERLVDQAGTLNCNMGQRGGWISGHPDPAYAISAGQQGKGGVFGRPAEVTPPLSADADKGDQDTIVAAPFTKAKRAQSSTDDESWVPGEVAPTQNQFDQGDTRATTVVCAIQERAICENPSAGPDGCGVRDDGAAYTLEARTVCQAVAFANRTRDGIKVPEVMQDGVVPALTNPGGGGRSDAVNVVAPGPVQVQWASGGGQVENPTMQALRSSAEYNYQFIRNAMQVRRLCPSECEALQGFPIGYTDVTYRKKPAADGPRYRALGNSMAVPCMWWLGYRIQQATG